MLPSWLPAVHFMDTNVRSCSAILGKLIKHMSLAIAKRLMWQLHGESGSTRQERELLL